MFKKSTLIFGLAGIFLIVGFFVAREALAVTASANYKIYGGQVGPNSAKVSSDNYIMQANGQPGAGKQTGTSYNQQSGAVFSRPAVVAEETAQSPGGGGGGALASEKVAPKIIDLWITSLKPDQTKITFNTDEISVCYLQYGIGEAYDKQTDSEASYGTEHSFLLNNLLPNTKYSFTAHLRDKSFNLAESQSYSFTTAPIIKTVPNVSQFVAVAGETAIKLSWKNPTVADFLQVKLMRSVSYFPLNDTEGEIMYVGKAESLVDTNVKVGVKYYYTLFAYDSSGNVSSGAVAMAKVSEIKPPVKPPVKPTEEKPVEKLPEEIIPPEKEKVEEIVVRETAKEIVLPKQTELPEGILPSVMPVGPTVGEQLKTGFFRMFTLVKREVGQSYEGIKNALNILSQGAKNTSIKVGVQLNVIKNGLVDQFGAIRQDVYDSLTPAEKVEVGKIIEDVTEKVAVKTFAPESIIKAIPLDTVGTKGADWHIVSGSSMLFTISAVHFSKPVRMVIVTLKDEAYIMKYNGETNNFEAVFKAPEDKGKYRMSIQIIYVDNTYEEIFHTVLVDPYGFVYTRKFAPNWSRSNPLLVSLFKVERVAEAEVALFVLNKVDEWVKWPADLYNQTNPQLTDTSGSFAFLSPAGKYRLVVKAVGYHDYFGEEFDVGTEVVNMYIELKKFDIGLWIAYVVSALFCCFVVVFLCKMWYYSNKKK